MEWMHGGGRDPNGRSLDDEIRIGKEDWLKSQQVTQGARVEMKPGGLVEPGVTHYGQDGRGLHARDMLTQQQQQLIKN